MSWILILGVWLSEDAPEDWSPVGVEQAIYKAAQRIAKGVRVCSKAFQAFKDADREFDRQFATAFFQAEESSVEAKKYRAKLETMDARQKRDIAEVAHEESKNLMFAIKDELEALRSIGVSVRQAYQNAGRGEH
ncbi:hypothetical protein [Mycobacteroides chelonae]|uniref:hypothetical protein n=1 Tax=Mycobacteroides chelonae TaxID=1774 RepID=UPI001041CFEA|nr:hypothetical protein [Mycobacteroides chelonae]